MVDDRISGWTGQIVGDDRSPGDTAEQLLTGRSVIVAGPLGAGKSHFLGAVAHELRARGQRPVIIRPATALSDTDFGAIDACDDGLASSLRSPVASDHHRLVLIVDDVLHLDAASAHAITRAISAGRAIALLALPVPRAGGADAERNHGDIRRLLVNLWLQGFADWTDFSPFSAAEADQLLDRFLDDQRLQPHALDHVTRAHLVWRANTSRLLLREFAREAASAVRHGRDPLTAVWSTPRHSRLTHALQAHLAEISFEEREALAFVHRLPRIALADARRFVPLTVIDRLLSAELLHADAAPQRNLTASPSLAAEAEAQLGAEAVDSLLDAAARRMIDDGGRWWSVPLALHIAESWHRGGAGPADPDAVETRIRERVTLDAARHTDGTADPALAASHAAMGLHHVRPPALALEGALAELTLDEQPPRSTRGVGSPAELRHRPRRSPGHESHGERPSPESDLLAATAAGDELDWDASARAAERAAASPDARAGTRLEAHLSAALARTCLGEWDAMQRELGQAGRLLNAQTRATALDGRDRLKAIATQLVLFQLAGSDAGRAREAVRAECTALAREGDPLAFVATGLAETAVLLAAGQIERATTEFRMATARRPEVSDLPGIRFVAHEMAMALAMTGRAREARSLLEEAGSTETPLMAHARDGALSTIHAAEGDIRRARDFAVQAALATEGRTALPLRARDLYRLRLLGAAGREHQEELRHLGETAAQPILGLLAELAAWTEPQGADVDPAALSPTVVLWSHPRPAGFAKATGARPVPFTERARDGATTTWGDAALTPREREIALLVENGLSNREIAERLYLSVRTVESHIYQARTKLGARSRFELGRVVASHTDMRTPL